MNKLLRYFLIFFILGCLHLQCLPSQTDWFKVNEKGFHSIIFKPQEKDSIRKSYSFFKSLKNYSNDQKIEMIEELLSFQNDMRISSLTSNHNKNLSQIYHGRTKLINVQTEALFLINQIYFDNPFYYSPIAILIDKQTQEEVNSDKKAMEIIYKEYNNWFKEVKRLGFEEAKQRDLKPLDNSQYKWIYGIDVKPNSPLMFEI